LFEAIEEKLEDETYDLRGLYSRKQFESR